MAKFGTKSKGQLATCDPRIQKIFNKVVEKYDCSVLQGRRGKDEQNEAYRRGLSKLKYPKSKHNAEAPNLSLAVDVVPYPIDWEDTDRFMHFAGYVKGVADSMGIKIRWGGDWDSDNEFNDQTFIDFPHFETKEG